MEICALCREPSHESVLVFTHVREGERVDLEVALCAGCGDRLEKHIKRAVPKRLMHFSPMPRLAAAGTWAHHLREAA